PYRRCLWCWNNRRSDRPRSLSLVRWSSSEPSWPGWINASFNFIIDLAPCRRVDWESRLLRPVFPPFPFVLQNTLLVEGAISEGKGREGHGPEGVSGWAERP